MATPLREARVPLSSKRFPQSTFLLRYMNTKRLHIFLSLFGVIVCFLLAVGIYTTPQHFLGIKQTISIAVLTKELTPTTVSTPTEIIKKRQNTAVTESPMVTVTPTSIPTASSFHPTALPTSQPSQASKPTVTMQIIEPDGNNNFTVILTSGNNLCDSLTEAKNEGKIRSLTLDYSYMSSLHSAYVRELNGYQNNWTVTVNGKSPQGCSLYTPNPGDIIVWKFG